MEAVSSTAIRSHGATFLKKVIFTFTTKMTIKSHKKHKLVPFDYNIMLGGTPANH
jgi:hypothetical protein